MVGVEEGCREGIDDGEVSRFLSFVVYAEARVFSCLFPRKENTSEKMKMWAIYANKKTEESATWTEE